MGYDGDGIMQLLAYGSSKDDPLGTLFTATLKFLQNYIEEGKKIWSLDKSSEDVQKHLAKCKGAYDGAYGLIEFREQKAIHEKKQMVASCRGRVVEITGNNGLEKIPCTFDRVIELYRQSDFMKRELFDKLIVRVATNPKVKGTSRKAPLKGLQRVIEKLVLRGEQYNPWDNVRAQVECEGIEQITEALKVITDDPDVLMHGLNDRFEDPPEGGWRDLSLYISFRDEKCQAVVAEIQLVHKKLMTVREEWQAHHAYDEGRFPDELRKKELIAAQLDDHLATPFSCRKRPGKKWVKQGGKWALA